MPRSPPKHRHDGTSPLPLGMDWSPPPKRWEGRITIWPHNHQTGWSYCVMIPSWIVQADPGVSQDTFLKSIVFYRIHVGIQSPEGVSSSHGVLRRFSDFLNLYSSLKKTFPKKDIPPAPPKHALLRINSSRLLLEEEDWDTSWRITWPSAPKSERLGQNLNTLRYRTEWTNPVGWIQGSSEQTDSYPLHLLHPYLCQPFDRTNGFELNCLLLRKKAGHVQLTHSSFFQFCAAPPPTRHTCVNSLTSFCCSHWRYAKSLFFSFVDSNASFPVHFFGQSFQRTDFYTWSKLP